MREYFHQQQGVQLREHAARVLPRLSTALQIEVVLHCHAHWLDKIWFLRDVEELCRVRLAMTMTARVLAPGEVAPRGLLYVISRGLVLFGGHVLTHGMAWGDDVLLREPTYYLPFLARAMSYVDAYTLGKETLARVLAAFPGSIQRVRRHTIFLALRRHLIVAARDVKAQRKGGRRDFIDRVHDAATGAARHAQLQSVNMAAQLEQASLRGSSPPTSPGHNRRRAGGSLHDPAHEEVRGLREDVRRLQHTVEGLATRESSLQQTIEQLAASVATLVNTGGMGKAAPLPRRAPTISAARAATRLRLSPKLGSEEKGEGDAGRDGHGDGA